MDCLSPEAQRLAEARLAAKRAARAEAREIRMKELERQQKEVEERPEKDFAEKASRNLPSLSAATLASLGGGTSRRNSGDTCTSVDTEASVREMRDSLLEAEEKYKKAMVSNAQLDNEKTNFMYQVDTLKDLLLELEEQLAESQRQCEEKGKELEREKHAHSVLQFQFAEVKEALKQREEMLEEIRQLRQKQAGLVREISDLQETVEWKDKKIGALERQKEFFDSVRSERDELREEIVKLKEEFKKHGIILNSETATNGETSRSLVDTVHLGLTCTSGEGLGALPAPGDGAPGRASEVPWTRGSVAQVRQTEFSPRTERDQPAEDAGKAAHRGGDNGEGQHAPEDRGPMAESLPESAGPGEPQQSPPEPEAEEPGCGVPAGPTPSSPLQSGNHLAGLGGRAADATEEQCPGLAHGPEEESTAMQGSSQGAQVGGSNHKEEDEEGGQRGTKPTQSRSGDPAAAPGTGEADSDPSAMKETDREIQGAQGETPDSSQKKAKNKKKKNKKKRAPAPADSGQDAEEDMASQSSDLGAVKGEEPIGGAEQPVPQAENEVAHTSPPEVAAGGDESREHPRAERGGGQLQEHEAGSTPGLAEGVLGAAEGGAPQKEEEEPSKGAKGSPPGPPTSPNSGAGRGMEQVSVEDSDSAPAGQPGSCCPEDSEDTNGSNGKGRGKEECALS